jgi:soluble lytic murein transglycosylase-like protein
MGASTRSTKDLPYLPQRAIRSNKGVAMRPATPLPLIFALLSTVAGSPARADIYSFIDGAGVTHFTNVPVDARYRLLLATPPAERAARPENWLARSAQFDHLIERAARSQAVRPELVRAVIVVESAFNPHALSRRGAMGLMQLLPKTARRYGVADAFDPEQNITAGVLYLHDLLTRYGDDLELTLAAYNAGEDAVERYGHSVPPFPETRHYVPTVLRIYRSLLDQQRRG